MCKLLFWQVVNCNFSRFVSFNIDVVFISLKLSSCSSSVLFKTHFLSGSVKKCQADRCERAQVVGNDKITLRGFSSYRSAVGSSCPPSADTRGSFWAQQTALWVIPHFDKALDKEYQLAQIAEVCHFERWGKSNPNPNPRKKLNPTPECLNCLSASSRESNPLQTALFSQP